MSASPIFPSAATGRPFILASWPRSSGALLAQLRTTAKLAAITPASRLDVHPAPEMVSSGIRELDALAGGLPRGCLTEICGPASSGRTSVLLSALGQATQRGEVCALVDASDALDPSSAAAARIEMGRLLWVRCGNKNPPRRHRETEKSDQQSLFSGRTSTQTKFEWKKQRAFEQRLEQVLKITDLLLQSNGFGMIVLDLGDIPAHSARRIPLASWFRFRRAVEHTPTVLLVLEQQPIAGSCSSMLVKVTGKKQSAVNSRFSANRPGHAELLDMFEITAELLRLRLERKSPQSATAIFMGRAAWAR